MASELLAGEITQLRVARMQEYGYFLTNGYEDVMLHKKEAKNKYEENDEVEVFLYHDHQGRLSATETMPTVTLDSFSILKVVEVKRSLGVFVDIGIQKDMLLSKDDLPYDWALWPAIGDELYCGLKLDKKQRLFADLSKFEEIQELSIVSPAESKNTEVEGLVFRFLEDGVSIITSEGYLAYLHKDEMKEQVRLGQRLTMRITFVREDGRVNVSTRPLVKEARIEDSDRLLTYMKERDNQMPFTDKSDPEAIKKEFNISKAAFKRAMGKLLKEKQVEQKDGMTFIKS
ncbi:CvfB family protein [Guptibacillus hwajinpoensis]|uniref:RNA-binding protein (Virulence factor B family) n=1 Tax=Guptibacillus hwajinpoensis TaxID=208199 RepID=A0ABU0K0Z0_9BACL|nr:S1-like domain-containing RNA-binding protein [Alkalihalobacillus hemicentroti]MDQ0483022.1 putative RNA-binding protein (virulence factor B family) [Alkalihalobacillus hemicentroti]